MRRLPTIDVVKVPRTPALQTHDFLRVLGRLGIKRSGIGGEVVRRQRSRGGNFMTQMADNLRTDVATGVGYASGVADHVLQFLRLGPRAGGANSRVDTQISFVSSLTHASTLSSSHIVAFSVLFSAASTSIAATG